MDGLPAGKNTRALIKNSDSWQDILCNRIGAAAVMVREAGQQIPKILSDKTERLRNLFVADDRTSFGRPRSTALT